MPIAWSPFRGCSSSRRASWIGAVGVPRPAFEKLATHHAVAVLLTLPGGMHGPCDTHYYLMRGGLASHDPPVRRSASSPYYLPSPGCRGPTDKRVPVGVVFASVKHGHEHADQHQHVL